MNVQGDYQAVPKALAAGIPLIFSGCTLENLEYWQVLASGVMANTNLNISFDEFFEALDVDYDVPTTITASTNSISVSASGTASVTATSDVSTAGGYIYAYTLDPAVATVVQSAWGSSATMTVTGVASGSTTLRLFTGSGEIVDIPVTVTS